MNVLILNTYGGIGMSMRLVIVTLLQICFETIMDKY